MDEGFRIVAPLLSEPEVETLRRALAESGAASVRGESVYARRNVLSVPQVAQLAQDQRLLALTGAATRPVRALFFDKVPGANWHVGWHQDRAIALAERRDVPGWGPWSVKAGVVHVLPPASLLERLITVRLHLDRCDASNGPLRVLPGSHRYGILPADQLRVLRKRIPEVLCTVPLGGALVMVPLLLHASSPAEVPHHRRVLHLEFAPEGILPEGLTWAA